MIEKIVLDYLNDVLAVPCYMEKPTEQEGKYVVIEKTSSSRSNHIDSATFALQSYANSLYDAAELNNEVKAAMDSIITLPSIFESALNSDYNYTDVAKHNHRYQAVYDLVFNLT